MTTAANSNFGAKFERCHAFTERWEGGWSDNPKDPGGKTQGGVTEKLYHAWLRSKGMALAPVRSISKATARQIFFEEFWQPVKAQGLVVGVDLVVYDAAVNSGVGRARKWLMASLGGTSIETIRRVCAKRLGFVGTLRTFATFGRGWSRRIADAEATATKWVLDGSPPEVATRTIQREAAMAQKKASDQARSGAGVGAGTSVGGAAGVQPEVADQVGGLILGGLLVAGFLVAAFLIGRAIINSQRAEAYARQIEGAK